MTNNPLIDKYNELYNPKPPESPKSKYSHLRYEDTQLIQKLERLLEDLKTGKATYQNYQVKDNHMRLGSIPPINWHTEPPSFIDSTLMCVNGQMITIEVFRSYG